ncbi:Lipid phosphate phosphatase-related protein type 2 [Chelonia mydas]|uniref:Lipid phosphate phosphatase-related protein type 2 n=1 Tax=Chelonia mydas TaxID=8469 RepID=M7BYU4_CHEMY|nr:Lipid phosphate phosphatase-related protein type 2 [Chelonia mydas]
MDALKGQVLTTKETTLITVSKEDKNRGNAPSGYLSRASSNAGLPPFLCSRQDPGDAPRQKKLTNELEIIKSQLHAQAKAFEALSHSVSLLEQESSLQQRKIQQLEEELSRACGPAQGEMFERLVDGKILEVWAAMAKEVEGLQESLLERPDHRMIQRGDSLENLSLEILESKKFLWEELESVQEDQEDDITKNLVSIKKMHENQVKCRKILSQLKGKGPGAEAALESVGRGRDSRPVKEELNDIWSAVNTLRNSMASCSLRGDGQAAVRVTGVYSFGLFTTTIFANAGQVVTGNQTPHFLSVCRPNYTALGCQLPGPQYITDRGACAGNPALVTAARKAFPSKDAALSAYAVVYTAVTCVVNNFRSKAPAAQKPAPAESLASVPGVGRALVEQPWKSSA